MKAVRAIWIDDELGTIHRFETASATRISIEAFESVAAAAAELRGAVPDLVVCDVRGGSPGHLRAIRDSVLAGVPLVLVSDAAREARLDWPSPACAVSSDFRLLEPPDARDLLHSMYEDLRDGTPQPSRAYLAHLVHEAKRSLALALDLAALAARDSSDVSGSAQHLAAVRNVLDLLRAQ